MILLQTAPTGIVTEILSNFGIPFADAIGSAMTFLLVFILIYVLGRIMILPLVDRLLDARGLDQHARLPIQKLAWVLILFGGVAIAFGLAGFGNFLTSLATIAAAATLAIGFALQDVIKNFVAGMFIFSDEPFRVGDWIEWDGNSGIVEDISFRVSRVRTFDNELLTVPNSQLTDGVIKNPVAKDQLRIKFLFGIDYDDDIERATDIIIEEAEAHPDVLEDPAPSVRLIELGDSYVGLQARIWIAQPRRTDFIRTRSEYATAVKNRFDENDITIPFPQRTLSGSLDVNTNSELIAQSE